MVASGPCDNPNSQHKIQRVIRNRKIYQPKTHDCAQKVFHGRGPLFNFSPHFQHGPRAVLNGLFMENKRMDVRHAKWESCVIQNIERDGVCISSVCILKLRRLLCEILWIKLKFRVCPQCQWRKIMFKHKWNREKSLRPSNTFCQSWEQASPVFLSLLRIVSETGR